MGVNQLTLPDQQPIVKGVSLVLKHALSLALALVLGLLAPVHLALDHHGPAHSEAADTGHHPHHDHGHSHAGEHGHTHQQDRGVSAPDGAMQVVPGDSGHAGHSHGHDSQDSHSAKDHLVLAKGASANPELLVPEDVPVQWIFAAPALKSMPVLLEWQLPPPPFLAAPSGLRAPPALS